jgi:beta-mannosidase
MLRMNRIGNFVLVPLSLFVTCGTSVVISDRDRQEVEPPPPSTYYVPAGDVIQITNDWRFRRAGGDEWHEAAVPGCVHTDLLANGLIKDPFYRNYEDSLQWIGEEDWEYEVFFSVKREYLEREHIELTFAGLDTYADVYLNDTLIITADNMFREWRTECGSILKFGKNHVRVRFRSPVRVAAEKWKELGYELPGGPKVVTRKAGYHYGWDWGPRFVTMGIWRPVYLRAWDRAVIRDLHIIQKRVRRERAELAAVFEVESSGKRNATVAIEHEGEELASREITLERGVNRVGLAFEILEPRLWWTSWLGEPFLYDFSGKLKLGKRLHEEVSTRIGIRTLEVVTERDEHGESFSIELNGAPVFMKGANHIPQDSFLPRVSGDWYEELLWNVTVANMNMLRVWGGGIYEEDIFYDLCDEYGILVWQDFMFACAMYPADDAFLENVRQEAVENVRRLRNHPCIALWCGNNEIDEAWHNWGWQRRYAIPAADSVRMWRDYERLFHDLLPAVVTEHDPDRFYWPSSPRHGRADPRSLTEGDAHYWGVWHDAEPFEVYEEKIGRFMSEYGFQSFPEMRTVRSFTEPEDLDIDSAVMRAHQKHPRGNELIRTYLERHYRSPKDFESFLYVSQLLQAEGIRTAIEAHRRAKPYCMGSLYWQLGDCWPVASWSGIDYYGRWKALHYFAANAFSEVLVSTVESEGVISVYVVSDRLEAFEGTVALRVFDFSGDDHWEREAEWVIEANSSVRIFKANLDTLLEGVRKERAVMVAEVWEGDERLSRNLHYFVEPRLLDLERPDVAVRVRRVEEGYSIECISARLVKNLYLQIDEEGFFTGNFFDLLPGENYTVMFLTDYDVKDLTQKLIVSSLIDSY